jgi:DNA ligase-1
MLYETLTQTYEELEKTNSRLMMIDILVELFKKCSPNEIEKIVYLTQGKLHPDWTGEPEIGMAEKMIINSIKKASSVGNKEIAELMSETGDIGIVAEKILRNRKIKILLEKKLSINDVYTRLDLISKQSGKGSVRKKTDILVNLMVNTTPIGARYLARIVTGSLRLGIGDMTILDALSLSYNGSKDNRPQIERAYNLSSDLGYVAKILALKKLSTLNDFKAIVGKPIRMMAAQRLTNIDEVFEKFGENYASEYKLDGERFQIHKKDYKVQIFSRRLENITTMYPDVVELTLKHVKASDAIIEGEAVAIDVKTGHILPFQVLMQRRRKHKIKETMQKIPIAIHLFDCLLVNGTDITKSPYLARRTALKNIIEQGDKFKIVKTLINGKRSDLEKFFHESISEGTEGLVIKSILEDSVYRAGARSWLWVKLKKSYQSKMIEPVDLVVIGASYGRGRRTGSYGALLVAAYDEEDDNFKTVCKVGTGFTDENLERIPEILKKYKINAKHPRVESLIDVDVWFSPEIVMEVLGDEITLSPVYLAGINVFKKDSGLAIRFPRFLRWRMEKSSKQATSVLELVEMYQSQLMNI